MFHREGPSDWASSQPEARPVHDEPRWLMSMIMMLLIAWGVLTGVLILLLIYRSTLTLHQDEQLFLDDASANLREEQEELQLRMKRVAPYVRILGAASGILILFIAGMAVWQQMNRVY
jgi:Tfp pilus assembly protein PilN